MKGNNRKRELEGECESGGDHRVMEDHDTKEVGNMKNPTVTVVIPAYNEEKVIVDTINSIRGQTYQNIIQILVVDDSSDDRTGEIARECGVDVVRTPSNSGTKSQALNFAFPYLKGELTATVDADTIIEQKAVEQIIEKYIEEPDIASACSFVIPQRRKNFWELSRTIEYLYGSFIRKKAQNCMGIPIVCSGCFSIFNTNLLKDYGFEERTIAEDMDLTWKLLEDHKKVRFFPDAVCYPKEPYSWDIYKKQILRWFRGYYQNFGVHKRDLWKNKRLALFLYWYLIEGLAALGFYGLLIWSVFFPFTQYLVVTSPVSLVLPLKYIGVWLFSIGVFGISVASFYQAHLLKISKWDVLKGLPCFLVLAMLNCAMFWVAFIYEWVLKRKLEVWQKGH